MQESKETEPEISDETFIIFWNLGFGKPHSAQRIQEKTALCALRVLCG
jgi:hypothetical protein